MINHVLRRAGFSCDDPHATWLVSVAAQRFALEIIHNAKGTHELREAGQKKRSQQQQQQQQQPATLTSEDLTCSLRNAGLPVAKAEYYVE